MCCRCYIEYLKDEELRKYYDLIPNKDNLKVEGEIYPTDILIVLFNNKDNKICVAKMKWGYSVNKLNIFNARMESLYTKDIFKDGINNHRCVIPVLNYFEWKKETKDKYNIKSKNGLTYLLGIYRIENNIPVFSVITKDAIGDLKNIHSRMPLIISKNNIKSWLKDDELILNIMNNSINDLEYKVI